MSASSSNLDSVRIPADLLPADGRFGCGPSLVPPAHAQALAASALLGTSHRQRPVRDLVAHIQTGLAELFALPDGWRVVLGNGGATAFWAVATASLVVNRAAHAAFGEFGAKFAAETAAAPFLADSIINSAPAGDLALADAHLGGDFGPEDVDVYAYPHHETSTGVLSPLYRPNPDHAEALTLVDATSIAGAVEVDLNLVDVYYFAPQKVFASEGGLWLALASPAAIERAAQVAANYPGIAPRWIPQFLDFSIAAANSAQAQTLNTPALATLELLGAQVDALLAAGGLAGAQARSREMSDHLYRWAEARPWAEPFVADAQLRSPVVATIDFSADVDAAGVARVLRAHGVVDVEPYRKLGRNQLRVATFPHIGIANIEALTACIDWVIEAGH